MVATMFGSLNVHTRPARSPRCRAVRSAKRAKRSAVAGSAQPPAAATHRGDVKWCSVTTGCRPCSRHVAQTRR
jgi:hypothetical protein